MSLYMGCFYEYKTCAALGADAPNDNDILWNWCDVSMCCFTTIEMNIIMVITIKKIN